MRNFALLLLSCSTCAFLVETISASPSHRENGVDIAIQESLTFIINHPINKARPASYLLGPPLTKEEIVLTLQPVLDNIDVSMLEQLIQLYEYTDGLILSESDGLPLHDLWLIPHYYLMSLKEAVETLMTMKHVSDVWHPTWLPVFSSRTGDFIVFDLGNGRIFEIFTKESFGYETAANIEEFVRQLAQNLRTGKVFVGKDVMMEETISDDGVVNEEFQLVQKKEKSFNLPVDQIYDKIYIAQNVTNTAVSEINVHEGVQQPNLRFNCINMPNICANIADAIAIDHQTRNLNRITDKTRIKQNRDAACGRSRCLQGESCDEYPFASTSQGGSGSTIRCVPARENLSQGGQLKKFYTQNNVGDGDSFRQAFP